MGKLNSSRASYADVTSSVMVAREDMASGDRRRRRKTVRTVVRDMSSCLCEFFLCFCVWENLLFPGEK